MDKPYAVFVTTFYRDVIGHAPTPATVNFSVKHLLAGTSLDRVAHSIWNSAARQNLVKRHQAPQMSWGAALAHARAVSQV